jgi:arginine deiminase
MFYRFSTDSGGSPNRKVMKRLGWCYAEYGRLRTVLMHTPGRELDLVGPATYERFLFADALDAEQFRTDHARFVDILRSEGIEVILLTEVLRHRTEMLRLAERLPNLVYTRDTAAVTTAGFLLARMKSRVRRGETRIVEDALRELAIPMFMKTQAPATIEGGDLVFLDEETLLLGVGNRTNRRALTELTAAATKSGLRRLVAVPLPRSVIHLDGTMMVVDRDLAVVHRRSLGNIPSVFEDGRLSRRVRFLQLLKANGMRLIEVTDYERQRRATNVIAIAPRKAVGYAGNARVKRELAENGVDLIEIEEAELIRGFGGPRCMTVPILRD